MSFISREQIRVFLIGVLIIVVLIAIAIGASFLSKKDPGTTRGDEESRTLTSEEKRILLEELSAPRDGGSLTDEEKKEILESLSTPREAGDLTEEEKKQILENLTAPR